MSEPDTTEQVKTADGPMPAYLWLPEGGEGPGMLLVQEIFGVSRYIRSRAADLAAAGYVVLAPELYWRLDDAAAVDETSSGALEQAMGMAGRLDWGQTVSDAVAALEHLRGLPSVTGGVGALGFCFGGGVAFNVAAEAGPDALVSYYGSALPGLLDLAPRVTMPSLHHFGLSDDYFPPDVVERIEQEVGRSGAARFHTYEGANHAFDNPDFMLHHPEASALAWERTIAFLHEQLPPRG